MKQLRYSILIALCLLLSLERAFAVFVVTPSTGHPGITVTISDNLGNDNSETIVGSITFGTVSVTTAGHALTAIKGVIAGDQVKTNLDGEYKVTFTVPVDATLVSGAYTVEIGEKKRDFLLTGPVQDAVNGQVGTALKISGKFLICLV